MKSATMVTQFQNSSKFTVRSSDVISDMRVNVFEEGTETVVWYKERFLSDDEIVEHIFDSVNSTICWTIHKPKRGWYIRIRAPSFPPGVFIPLIPVPRSEPYHTDAGITFSCRTDVPSKRAVAPTLDLQSPPATAKSSLESDATLTEAISPSGSGPSTVHSYPPTPPSQVPSFIVHPPSPESVLAKLDQCAPPPRYPKSAQITKFLLAPHWTTHGPQQTGNTSLFTRVFSAFKNHAPSHSYSFTLSQIPSTPMPPSSRHNHHPLPLNPTPLLSFHDQTPVLTVRSTTGVIEINNEEQRAWGVAPSFWIAIALTYLEFLSDRESYLAAASGD